MHPISTLGTEYPSGVAALTDFLSSQADATSCALTVVIPTHNRATFLEQAINSVLTSRLIQSPNQIVVVDDNSSDHTASVAAASRVRYLREECGGPSRARNAGLALVQSPYVAFLDDDDVWLPGNMEAHLAALQAYPRAAFAYGRVRLTAPDLTPFGRPMPDGQVPSGDILDFLCTTNLQVGSMAFRTSIVKAHGGFDETLRYGEDWDLWVRLAAKHPALGIDSVGSLFRQRTTTASDFQSRWIAYGTFWRRRSKLRAMGIRQSRVALARQALSFRGHTVYWLCVDSQLAAREARSVDSLVALSYALRVSPFHALRNWTFWRAVARLATVGIASKIGRSQENSSGG